MNCKDCRYCQIWSRHDKYGRYIGNYYGCNRSPNWGKDIDTIVKCPKDYTQKDLDRIAAKLNGR